MLYNVKNCGILMKECCITALSDMPWYNTSVLKKRIQEIYAAMRRNGEQHEKVEDYVRSIPDFPEKELFSEILQA